MTILVYDNDETFQPSDEDKIELVDQITSNYKKWDDDRVSQRQQYEQIKNAIYIDTTQIDRNAEECILLPQIYEQKNTIKASLLKSNFQNNDMVFNVRGKDLESDANATLQKANLKDAMKLMKFHNTAEKSLDELLEKGEMISFTFWETKVEMTRRQVPVSEDIIHPETGEVLGSQMVKKLQRVPKIVYDGAKVSSIDPLAFVFDKNEYKNDKDACNKITYSLVNPMDILANEDYNLLDNEQRDFIKAVASNEQVLETDKYYQDTYSGVRGRQLVVLELWGDIRLSDGTVLKNYVATVVGDMFLARLEPNPYIRNPFAITQWMPDPDTGRGRSPLLVAVPINQVSSQILNGQVRGMKLSLNPPMLAPMDFFTQDRIALYPGKIVPYNDIYGNGSRQPTPYSFKDGMLGFDFLTFFETKIEASTGGFKYMVGTQDAKTRTATETSATVTGQNTRLSMMINIINDEWTIPTIENIAALQANTDFDTKTINVGDMSGSKQFAQITPEIRQGNYQYEYGDSQAIVETEAKMQKIANMIAPFVGKADINYDGWAKLVFNKMNIDGAEQIFNADPIDKAIQGMVQKPIPPQYLNEIKQQFVDSGMLQQVVQQMMMAQQPQQPQGGMYGTEQGASGIPGSNAGVVGSPELGNTPQLY